MFRGSVPAPARSAMLWVASVLAILGPPGVTPVDAQEGPVSLDLRVGAVYSSPLVTGSVQALDAQGTNTRDGVETQPGVGPLVDAALRFGLSPRANGELRLGVSTSGLSSSGPGGSWDAGDVTAVSAVAALAVELISDVTVKGGLGTVFYSSEAPLFEGGSSTGLMLTGGVGYWLPMELPVDVRLDGDVQWSGFGTPALREAGAADGAVYRVIVGLAATFGGSR